MRLPLQNYRTPLVALLIPLFLAPAVAHAEFSLNFQPGLTRLGDPEWLNFNCNRPRAPGSGFEECDKNDLLRGNNGRDTTPFLMERVRDPLTGEQYYHTIIGLPGDDFVQEAYIKIVRYMNKDNGGYSTTPQAEVDDLGPISDSLGNWGDLDKACNNACDPLGPTSFSGSGSANPKSTQFRQVVTGNGLHQEIIKTSFNKKPHIIETINAGALSHEFEMDMSNSSYDQANIAAMMNKNRMRITDGNFTSDFDINNLPAGSRSGVRINGGKFLYSQKYTTSMSGGPFQNEYVGEGAGYNTWTELWQAWRDPAQNPTCSSSNDGDSGGTGQRCHLYGGGGNN